MSGCGFTRSEMEEIGGRYQKIRSAPHGFAAPRYNVPSEMQRSEAPAAREFPDIPRAVYVNIYAFRILQDEAWNNQGLHAVGICGSKPRQQADNYAVLRHISLCRSSAAGCRTVERSANQSIRRSSCDNRVPRHRKYERYRNRDIQCRLHSGYRRDRLFISGRMQPVGVRAFEVRENRIQHRQLCQHKPPFFVGRQLQSA